MEFVRGNRIDGAGNDQGTIYVNPARVESVREYQYEEVKIDEETNTETRTDRIGSCIQLVGDTFYVEWTPQTWVRKIEAELNPKPEEKG